MKLVTRYNEIIRLTWVFLVLICSVLLHRGDEPCCVKCINKAE